MNFIEELTGLCKRHGLREARVIEASYESVYMSTSPEITCVVEFKLPSKTNETMQRIMNRGGNLL